MATRLPERACHFFFLKRLAAERAPGAAGGTAALCLGDLTTAQARRPGAIAGRRT